MNPIIANERNKKKCQKFTPLNKVDDMLDLAGYSRDLFGKKVLEYSFGSGNIIKQIVKRYVEDALTQNIDVNNISSGLSADIYGIELDPQLYDQCISDLNEIVRSYGISTVNWSFVCTDALQWTTDIKFDLLLEILRIFHITILMKQIENSSVKILELVKRGNSTTAMLS